MSNFLYNYRLAVFYCMLLFISVRTEAQVLDGDNNPILASSEKIAHAVYVTDSTISLSNDRREEDTQERVGAIPEDLHSVYSINGRNFREGLLIEQSYYLSKHLHEGYWWYLSGITFHSDAEIPSTEYIAVDSISKYYDDMITISFNSTMSILIEVFDANDYLLATDTVFISFPVNYLSLSPGHILTGSQTVIRGQGASNLKATSAWGGICDSLSPYVYQWQTSFNGTTYTDVENATLDSLVVNSTMEQLLGSGKNIIYIRRRAICNSDTAYAQCVSIKMADSVRAGEILPHTQTISYGSFPAHLYGSDPSGGICNGEYTFKWQYSADSTNFTQLNDQTTDSLPFTTGLNATSYYRRITYCNHDSAFSNTVKVNVTSPFYLKPGVNTAITANPVTALPLPAFYADTPVHFMRVYAPNIPIQDTAEINMTAEVEDVGVISIYKDSYGRTLQTIAKQTSPLKKDNVIAANYDEFGRTVVDYLPFTSTGNDGNFKTNPFYQDSTFYKGLFPNEKINYGQIIYDGSPFNIPVYTKAPGNSWGGSNRAVVYQYRTNSVTDSVRQWTIPVTNEDNFPQSSNFYLPSTLTVQDTRDEAGMEVIKFTDEVGRTVLTKTLLQSSLVYGQSVWLSTYYVYDEMNHLRVVIPPKAADKLKTASINWNFSADSSINTGLCYAYYYDELGRVIMKRIPGKGKSYIAYDLLNRVVMTQDPHLRLAGQWSFVLYDGQSRPVKSGVITTSLIKDSIWAQASRSASYPTLSGTYQVMGETYYDDYSWIAATGAPVDDSLNTSNINSANFNTSYNTAPDYAQAITKSLRIRGAVTGSKKLILNSSDWLYNVNFYDSRGLSIQTQQTNYSGGTDIATIQYAYNGRILSSFLKHQKSGTNAQVHTLLTKYEYDHVGRILSVTKNFDSLGNKIISKPTYNELGQVERKVIGDSLETQDYSYNIRGWLLGINTDYVKSSSSTDNYFGEILAYDSGFVNTQYNGNIAGIQWKAAGDQVARAYGFNYDKANRLKSAEFFQQNSGSTDWTNDKVDYTVSGLTYDANGNILTMKQRGLMVGSSATIDSLTYQYFSNSNLLQKVTDGIADMSPLGDFKDTSSVDDDYAYDANGNIITDNNRHLHKGGGGAGAAFNLLDKPDSMMIAGKSGTHYYYDAGGNTLRKQVNDSSNGMAVTKNYVYISGFVYLNDTLQYALMEEGRIRYAQKRKSSTGSTYYAYEYDYFLKDHQGNVRAVITEGKDTSIYQATMETADSTKEDALFANEYSPNRTINDKPSGFDTDAGNHRVSRLNAASGGTNHKTGPSLVLKVMAGDKVQINTFAFYNTTVQAPAGGVNLLSEILSFLPGAITSNSGGKLVPGNSTTLSSALIPNVTEFLNDDRPYDDARPKAYLNWILFDEQFNYVAGNSGVIQVEEGTEKQPLVAPLQTIGKNGFLYIYVSNESPQDVYFDDLTVKHYTGPLIQEQSYYPFGLQMAGISSKAVLKTLSAYKYNGGSELEDEAGLDYYNTFYRKYDAQIGRFTGVDVMAESNAGVTPFHFGGNNPILFNDPLGDRERMMREENEDPGMKSLGNDISWERMGQDWTSSEDFYYGGLLEALLQGGGGTVAPVSPSASSINCLIPGMGVEGIPGLCNFGFGASGWGFYNAAGTFFNPAANGADAQSALLANELTDYCTSTDALINSRMTDMLTGPVVNTLWVNMAALPATSPQTVFVGGVATATNTLFNQSVSQQTMYETSIGKYNGARDWRASFAGNFLSAAWANANNKQNAGTGQTDNGTIQRYNTVKWVTAAGGENKVRNEIVENGFQSLQYAADYCQVENHRLKNLPGGNILRTYYVSISASSQNVLPGNAMTSLSSGIYGVFKLTDWHY